MRDRNGRSHRAKGTPDGGRYDGERRGGDGGDLEPPDGAGAWPPGGGFDPFDEEEAELARMGAEQERVLADACAARRPLTDFERERRREYIRRVVDATRGHDTRDTLTAGTGRYPEWRRRIHREIIDAAFARADRVGLHRRALMSGGLGGSGKSSTLASPGFRERFPGFRPDEWLTLNNDDVKEELAKRGCVPHVRGLTPMECCFLVHEEASDILRAIRRRALDEGMDVIVDGTMNDAGSTERKIRELRDAGYAVDAMFVDISPDTSKRRADGRYRDGMTEYTTSGGTQGSGGRYLPDDVVDGQRPADPAHRSRNAETLIALESKGLFDNTPIIYDNDIDGRRPRPVPYAEFSAGPRPASR
ncbi:zeta toxin family protein [Bifidobacterium myosotis]|uniref:UDP-N-acetylglucosamine kinase n=1 Tax=Bifidobacterium myosotis TaxID=1630166 RepID=A0A5M9ZKM2_9BIFI|nr:zeta toxin family protein [Bifidobacterium myosotis]KAA8828166.1 hypothetical protein EMO91_06925 [Bifidobacterium myosotis]